MRALTMDEVWGSSVLPQGRWSMRRWHRHDASDERAGRGSGEGGRPGPGPGPGPGHRGSRRARRQGWGWGGQGYGGWWGGEGDRPRSRPRRGDVRLAVLLLLDEQPMHGYQIITELTERSDGLWRPSPGSVYPTLQQLEDEGLVAAAERDGRRTFALTDSGRATVEALPEGRRAPWEDMAAPDDGTGGLRRRAMQVAAAVMQVATGGSDEQIAHAEQVLADTQRALYRLLSEDPADA